MRSLLFSLLLLLPGHAEPLISEFMASNQSGILDERGSRPDWIEILNPDAAPVLMTGWALTDNPGLPRKWVFPPVTIPGNSHLLVFASGIDRRVPGQNLHTNFSLAAGGEYLALVRPAGTAATEWSPAYPAQFPDISYGTSTTTQQITWVQQSSPVKAMVPVDTSLIPQWRTPAFNDTAWTSGTFGVGYMNATANPNLSADLGVNFGTGSATPMNNASGRHSYSRAAFPVADRTKVVSLLLRMNYDDGFVAWINGTPAANSAAAPTTDPISPVALVGTHSPGAFEDFPLPPAAVAALVNGTNVLAIEGMNTTTGSSDAIVIAQLTATLSTPGSGITGYFSTATPGTANGGANTIQLPNNIVFSRPSGTYSAAFDLTLSGALAGQEIRYTISDPSGTGASQAQPTPASTLYSAPIPISTANGKLIRAAIFQGAQQSRTLTAQYLSLETATLNNTSNFTSTLPVIVLDDHGAGQPVDSSSNTFTTSMMHVFEPVAGTTRLADAATGNGVPGLFTRSGTRVRGSSSAGFAKKSYGVETWDEADADLDHPLLGLAADSDWILNGPFLFDDTFIHNAFIYEISRRIGRWAPRTRVCEVFFNQNGGKLDYSDYVGIYILTEKIKSAKHRLDIAGLQPEDTTGAALTGGYIFKIDRADPGEFAWNIDNSAFGLGTLPNPESGQALVLVEPDPDFDLPQQQSYIQTTAILPWNNTLFTERAAQFTSRAYRNPIDTASFVDHHLLNSLAFNVDALRLSAFFFKDREGRIEAGPIWDFDRSLGSDDSRDATPASWNNIGYFFDRDWWNGVFRDPQFVQEVVDRWWELRQPGRAYETTALLTLADQMGAEIGNPAAARDAARWPDNAAAGGVYLNEIAAMKSWLTTRGTFMDGAMPTPPAASLASGTMTPGSTVTLSGTGTIRYTLNGTDPRPFGGALPGGGTSYGTPIPINATTVLTARRQGTFTPFPNGAATISWSAPRTRVYLVNEAFATAGDLSISEVNFHPLGPTAAELLAAPGTSAADYEWIELKNTGTRTVNTFELRFPAGYPFERELRLAPLTLTPGSMCLVVKNSAAFQARYGTGLNAKIAGEWIDGTLDNSGEEIRLLARDASTLAAFSYSDGAGWPDRADGQGAALEYTGTLFTTPDYNTATNWRSSSAVHGSPGAAGAAPDTRIAINEILSHSNAPRVDAIELRNNSGSPVDVGGWYLSDTGSPETVADYQKFTIPPGTVIAAGGYLVLTETAFNPNGAWNPTPGVPGAGEFAFDGQHGDDAWLVSNTAGVLRFADHVDFGAARPDESWGRLPNGTGPLVPMLARTLLNEASPANPRPGLGAPNSGIRTGPLIIQEIHHAPPGGITDLEFVEIFNPTATPVSLTNWKLRGDADYNFGAESIPAGGTLVVTPFSTSETAKAASFRATYGIDTAVVLTGPWNGSDHLGTPGTVRLLRAEPPPAAEPGFIPLSLEDEAVYSGLGSGWPDTTAGASLNRASRDYGGLAASWFSGAPTPGNARLGYAYWKSILFPAGGAASAGLADPDKDGLDNAMEFALKTDPLLADGAPALPAVTSQAAFAGSTDFHFTYHRPLEHTGVSYTVEKSINLTNWIPVPDAPVSTATGRETRRATVNAPPSVSRLYFRLSVVVTQ
jgi:CotH kinase protein/Lamin Tail Domain/Chitobiase/beta-hexosaminidase C-terminal domain